MKKYKIYFGTDFRNTGKVSSLDILTYYDKNNSKTVKDLKNCITYLDETICTCMLKVYKKEKGYVYDSYTKYDVENEDNEKLEKISENGEIYIIQTKKDCSCNFLLDNKELCTLYKKELIEKINKLEKKSELEDYKQNPQEDFYDIIIDVNSILNLKKGWKIYMTESGLKKYIEYKDQQLIKIGILGNIDRGKTFILSQLSKILFPSGTSINTKGLSIKFPDLSKGFDNRKYILLDSAGLETPILNIENEEENNDKNIIDNVNFKQKARDILVTESFLQSFIINNSDILILVIDKLSFSEQKLINKIKSEIISNYSKKKKNFYIIHNLKHYTKKSQVEEYIDQILNKSSTFSVVKNDKVTSNKDKILNGVHFHEVYRNDIDTFHLLFAQDGSEAGNYYNPYTINFIEQQYDQSWEKGKFDVIEELKANFSVNSKLYLEEKIDRNEFNSNEDTLENKIIRINEDKQLTLKKCLIDEIGNAIFKMDHLEPKYNFFVHDNLFEIRVELPGNVVVNKVKAKVSGENTCVEICGEKKYDKVPKNVEDNEYNNREFGKFDLTIAFKTEKFKINQSKVEKKMKQGILFIQYPIDKDEENDTKTVENEEEI